MSEVSLRPSIGLFLCSEYVRERRTHTHAHHHMHTHASVCAHTYTHTHTYTHIHTHTRTYTHIHTPRTPCKLPVPIRVRQTDWCCAPHCQPYVMKDTSDSAQFRQEGTEAGRKHSKAALLNTETYPKIELALTFLYNYSAILNYNSMSLSHQQDYPPCQHLITLATEWKQTNSPLSDLTKCRGNMLLRREQADVSRQKWHVDDQLSFSHNTHVMV